MQDQSRVLFAALVGAAAGAAFGFLYLTERGCRVRNQIEPKLDDFVTEVRRMRGTVERARDAATEGWQSLNAMLGEGSGGQSWPAARGASH